MKLEEVIPYIRAGKDVEFLGWDRNSNPEWKRVVLQNTDYREYEYAKFSEFSLFSLLALEFRLKKEKVKRYQVIYAGLNDGKDFYATSPKLQKYKNKEDFDHWVFNENKEFVRLILASEEEYDE